MTPWRPSLAKRIRLECSVTGHAMSELIHKRTVSTWLLMACGVWLVGLGIYFLMLRPPLLPEDLRFMGTTLTQLREAAPGLERWLAHVFSVMGGFMAGAGVLTIFVAKLAAPAPRKASTLALGLAGALTVAWMSAVNFALDSDFKWLLLMPPVFWFCALAGRLRGD